jgi:predicted dehydrogenase
MLVVGAGSIGRRHLANLRALGVRRLGVVEPDERRRGAVAEDGVEAFATLDQAIAALRPDAACVCTPPTAHVEPALALLRAGADLFVEKPLAATMEGVDRLAAEAVAGGRIVQVGYNLRFHPVLVAVRALLDGGTIGRVLYAHAQVGQYLPDWRPRVDYRHSYTAQAAQGGGILLDASHEIDYVTWLLGAPETVACAAGKVSDLEVNVEDSATLLLGYSGQAHAVVHLDFVRRGYKRTLDLVGELGNIVADIGQRTVVIERSRTEVTPVAVGEQDMYVEEMRHFLDCCRQRRAPAVGLAEGIRTLEIVLAAKAAARDGAGRRLR